MKYGFTKLPNQSKDTCLILGIVNKTKASEILSKIGTDHKDLISSVTPYLSEEYDNIWHATNNGNSVYIINCGDKKNYDALKINKLISIIASFILNKKIENAHISLPQVANKTPDWQAQEMILQLEALRYQFLEYKTKNTKKNVLQSIQFDLHGTSTETITISQAIAKGIKLTKDLANRPANDCTPSHLSEQAHQLEKEFKSITTKTLNTKEMQEMGMGALLAVGQGSIESPKLIEIQYNGKENDDPIVLVGKGITFDSGGISLKPPAGMEEMKFDMCGAASVLGTIKACALLNLPIKLIGILACAENMPSGSALKPGDIITSLSGQTIEVTNTDAEGRLVLADALTYVERFNPKFVIDIATLTGAVIIALGHESTGLLTNDDKLADLILTAAKESQDKTWRLPLDSCYKELLESPVADLVNSPAERIAGSIIAGSFLSHFTTKYRWAHLDIAGTAWVSGKNRKATGRPVPLLIQILRTISHAD